MEKDDVIASSSFFMVKMIWLILFSPCITASARTMDLSDQPNLALVLNAPETYHRSLAPIDALSFGSHEPSLIPTSYNLEQSYVPSFKEKESVGPLLSDFPLEQVSLNQTPSLLPSFDLTSTDKPPRATPSSVGISTQVPSFDQNPSVEPSKNLSSEERPSLTPSLLYVPSRGPSFLETPTSDSKQLTLLVPSESPAILTTSQPFSKSNGPTFSTKRPSPFSTSMPSLTEVTDAPSLIESDPTPNSPSMTEPSEFPSSLSPASSEPSSTVFNPTILKVTVIPSHVSGTSKPSQLRNTSEPWEKPTSTNTPSIAENPNPVGSPSIYPSNEPSDQSQSYPSNFPSLSQSRQSHKNKKSKKVKSPKIPKEKSFKTSKAKSFEMLKPKSSKKPKGAKSAKSSNKIRSSVPPHVSVDETHSEPSPKVVSPKISISDGSLSTTFSMSIHSSKNFVNAGTRTPVSIGASLPFYVYPFALISAQLLL